MIIKLLSEEDEEEKYEKLSAWRQLEYHKLVNDIEKEQGEFVVVACINENLEVGHVVKMHYGEFGKLVTDSIQKF